MTRGHALVVGATSGIGAEVARQLAAQGWRVSRFGRSATGAGGWPCDVTDARSVTCAFAAAAEAQGEPRALVYCAGAGVFGRTAAIPPEHARACMDVGFWGMDLCVREVLPAFERRGGGHIVGVLSVVAMIGVAHEAHYAASKAAAQRYLDCLRLELEPAGVRVRYVCPGYVPTGFRERALFFGIEPGVVHGSGITAAAVAARIADIVDGRERGPVLGWREQIITTAGRVAPALYEGWQARRRRRG